MLHWLLFRSLETANKIGKNQITVIWSLPPELPSWSRANLDWARMHTFNFSSFQGEHLQHRGISVCWVYEKPEKQVELLLLHTACANCSSFYDHWKVYIAWFGAYGNIKYNLHGKRAAGKWEIMLWIKFSQTLIQLCIINLQIRLSLNSLIYPDIFTVSRILLS